MANVAEFILTLARDHREMALFKEDSATYISNSSLSPEQKKVVASADPVQIRHAIESEGHGIHPDNVYVIISVAITIYTRPPNKD